MQESISQVLLLHRSILAAQVSKILGNPRFVRWSPLTADRSRSSCVSRVSALLKSDRYALMISESVLLSIADREINKVSSFCNTRKPR